MALVSKLRFVLVGSACLALAVIGLGVVSAWANPSTTNNSRSAGPIGPVAMYDAIAADPVQRSYSAALPEVERRQAAAIEALMQNPRVRVTGPRGTEIGFIDRESMNVQAVELDKDLPPVFDESGAVIAYWDPVAGWLDRPMIERSDPADVLSARAAKGTSRSPLKG